jgi:hypothetical protein
MLTPQNGFHIERIVVKEMHDGAPWYAVTDPAVLGRRVEWQPLGEAHLMVYARKERTVEIFNPLPQQSDYVHTWTTNTATAPTAVTRVHHHVARESTLPPGRSLRSLVWGRVPLRVKTTYRRLKRLAGVLGRASSHPDPACFTRLEMPQLTGD